ncbi:sugar ABC transporter substrate-binding protein [Streptomyces sp. ME19-01-6]|uniref:ABC transporter substrate-binding protein n=1 Tax=Streptomyces sp. ME19-01-6 TaxID=3028686 RepID=UPI0029A041FB|nr:sugar ABC transporter substrate-binding protein [Streptomyces sp. ME19-01-6]MDX3231079.1 sugar ABC transporter substrate-binding protein [Streptomyces sp. ME19-01-6]
MIRTRKGPVRILTAAVALSLFAVGCANGEGSGKTADGKTIVKIAVWDYEKTPEFKALIDGFEAENPKIDVQPVDILSTDYSNKLTTMLAGGDSTDVLTMKNVTDYARYGTRGQLQSLTTDVNKLDKAKYSGLDAFDLKGDYYALPYRQDFWVLFYNKTLLKKSGADPSKLTWSEYADLAKKLTTGSGSSKVYGTYHQTWRSVVQAVASAQTGGDLLSGDYGFFKKQYEMALGLQKDGAVMPFATAKSQQVKYDAVFATGKTAMVPMGTWLAARMLQLKAQGQSVDWGMAPLPQTSANGKTVTFGSPTAFAVNKKARNSAAAKKFVLWASGPKGAAAIAKVGVVPSYTDDAVMNNFFGVKGMPNDALSKKAMKPDTVKLEMPVSTKSSDIDQILTEEHELVMSGEKSIDKGIQEMESRVKSEVE